MKCPYRNFKECFYSECPSYIYNPNQTVGNSEQCKYVNEWIPPMFPRVSIHKLGTVFWDGDDSERV